MNTLDLMILLVLVGGMIHGFSTGLIKQVASLAGLVIAFIVSVQLMHPVGGAAADSLGISSEIAPLVGFVLVFLGVQLVVFALAKTVESLVGALHLTGINRLLGGALGAFKAALLASVLFLVLRYVELPSQELQQDSMLYPSVSVLLPGAWDYVSDVLPEVQRLSERFGEQVGTRLP